MLSYGGAPRVSWLVSSSPILWFGSTTNPGTIPPRVTKGVDFFFVPGSFVYLRTRRMSKSSAQHVIYIHIYILTKSFYKKLKNVSCEYDRLNGWNSNLQAAWYIRHVRWTCLFYISFIIWFLWTKPTIWLLILSFTKKIARACSMFYSYERYRSVTPMDAARVDRMIFHNHSVHWYYITLIEGRDYI